MAASLLLLRLRLRFRFLLCFATRFCLLTRDIAGSRWIARKEDEAGEDGEKTHVCLVSCSYSYLPKNVQPWVGVLDGHPLLSWICIAYSPPHLYIYNGILLSIQGSLSLVKANNMEYPQPSVRSIVLVMHDGGK